MPNEHFLSLLERSKEIHVKKSQDYTTNTESNPHENFERANLIASWFPDKYKSFAVLIGTKLARLASLLTKEEKMGYVPNNESTDDTFLDTLTYVGLWFSYWKSLSTFTDKDFQITPDEIIYKDSCNVHDTFQKNCLDCLNVNSSLFNKR